MPLRHFEVDVPIRNTETPGLEGVHVGRADGWGACGYRPGWELDCPAAKVTTWKNPWLDSYVEL